MQHNDDFPRRSRAATALEAKADVFFIPQTNPTLESIDTAKRVEVFEDAHAAMLRNVYAELAGNRVIKEDTWDFLMDVKEIRAYGFPQSALPKLNFILEKYINVNSSHQLNISDNQRLAIQTAIKSGNDAKAIQESLNSAINTVVIANFFRNFYEYHLVEKLTNAEKITILAKDIFNVLEKLDTLHKRNSLKNIIGSDAQHLGLDEEKLSDDPIKQVFTVDLTLIHTQIQSTKPDPSHSESQSIITELNSLLTNKTIKNSEELKLELTKLFSNKNITDGIEQIKKYIDGLIAHEKAFASKNTLSQYLNFLMTSLETNIKNLSLDSLNNLYVSTEEKQLQTRERANTEIRNRSNTANKNEQLHNRKESTDKHYQYVRNEVNVASNTIEVKADAKKKDLDSVKEEGFFKRVARSLKGKNKKAAHTRVTSKDDIRIGKKSLFNKPIKIEVNNNSNNSNNKKPKPPGGSS